MAILRRTVKAVMRAMCGVKIIEKRKSQELMSLLGLKQGCPKFLHGGPYCTFHELSRATQLLVKCLEYFYSETYTLSFVLSYKIKEF